MSTYLTEAEIRSVVKDRYGDDRRERIVLSPKRRRNHQRLTVSLLSLIYLYQSGPA